MALHPCPECQKDVSDKAPTCPHCGMPLKEAPSWIARNKRTLGGVVALAAVVGGGGYLAFRPSEYQKVEQLRAEQDALGTHNEHVRQRFFRLHNKHPNDAMYTYLWARCVEEPDKQLALAEEGIREDPRFSWNYNMASRALARLDRVPEALDRAKQGIALDPGNMQLSEKQRLLQLLVDKKLSGKNKPSPTAYAAYDKEGLDKTGVHYRGLFRGGIRSPASSDLHAIQRARLGDYKGPMPEAVWGFSVCANPFTDSCMHVFVPRDARFKPAWPATDTDVRALKQDQVVTVAGAVVTNGQGDNIMLADAVTVEAK